VFHFGESGITHLVLGALVVLALGGQNASGKFGASASKMGVIVTACDHIFIFGELVVACSLSELKVTDAGRFCLHDLVFLNSFSLFLCLEKCLTNGVIGIFTGREVLASEGRFSLSFDEVRKLDRRALVAINCFSSRLSLLFTCFFFNDRQLLVFSIFCTGQNLSQYFSHLLILHLTGGHQLCLGPPIKVSHFCACCL